MQVTGNVPGGLPGTGKVIVYVGYTGCIPHCVVHSYPLTIDSPRDPTSRAIFIHLHEC